MSVFTMEIVLAIATLLGGGSAIWLFWDKLSAIVVVTKNSDAKISNSMLSLPDEEFSMLEKILSFPLSNIYLPTSEHEIDLCKSLVNYGFLIKTGDSSFKLTKNAKKAYV